jgi:hypothetical protein
MGRKRFDHLVLEISLAVGRRIPRYPLWLYLHEVGLDPEALTPDGAAAFCRGELRIFLSRRGLALGPRAERRVERAVRRFDPRMPAPEERLGRSFAGE